MFVVGCILGLAVVVFMLTRIGVFVRFGRV
jgi:hypothetical protein